MRRDSGRHRKGRALVGGLHAVLQTLAAHDLGAAVKTAYERAVCGDIVTLSPACAAFDQFANFMERGKAFKKLVMGLGE